MVIQVVEEVAKKNGQVIGGGVMWGNSALGTGALEPTFHLMISA